MIVYAESSAVLAWLLGEAEGTRVCRLLAGAERVVASTLTPLECARSLARGVATGRVKDGDDLIARRLLAEASRGWTLLEMSGSVLDRTARRFPAEPVRTLDAFHLASAAVFDEALGGVVVLSLDERIRANAAAMGMKVSP